jgi:hypothetical protein
MRLLRRVFFFTTMNDWRTVEMPGAGVAPSSEHYAAAIAAINHAIGTCPGTELPPLGQDREYEDWVAEHARYAVSGIGAGCQLSLMVGDVRYC